MTILTMFVILFLKLLIILNDEEFFWFTDRWADRGATLKTKLIVAH